MRIQYCHYVISWELLVRWCPVKSTCQAASFQDSRHERDDSQPITVIVTPTQALIQSHICMHIQHVYTKKQIIILQLLCMCRIWLFQACFWGNKIKFLNLNSRQVRHLFKCYQSNSKTKRYIYIHILKKRKYRWVLSKLCTEKVIYKFEIKKITSEFWQSCTLKKLFINFKQRKILHS